MSLILDALRKSEAERRHGQVPDLFAPVAARVAPAAKPSTALMLLGIFAVIATAAIALWPRTESLPVSAPAPVEIAAAPASQTDARAPSPADTAMPAPPKPIAAATPSIKPRLTPPPPTKPAPVTPVIAPVTESLTPIDDSVPSNGGADAANDSVAQDALPTLATLDSATRSNLPPLQLSMHVWNEDASRRFAIIDGQRVGEGGRVGGAVVAAIRRDGVVLDVDNRQFLLPRP